MPEDILDPAARAAANAAAIQTQGAQDISGQPTGRATDVADTAGSLDSLRDAVVAKKAAEATDEEGGKPAAKSDDNKKVADDKAAIDKKAADDKAAADKAATDAATAAANPADNPAATEAAKALEAEKAEQKKAADEFFKDSPTLPPKASAKSAEAFEAVKVRAAQEIKKLQADIAKHEAELKTLREASKEALTPEVRKEIESLREFRSRMDVETDPKFKVFDADIKKANDFIYAQLRKSPIVTDAVIADIEKLGGPANVKMEAIFEGIKDPMIQRLVEGKLAEVELKKYEKDQAIAAAKTNITGYLAERTKQWESSATSHNQSTKAELDALVTRIPWLVDVKPDSAKTPEEKAAATAHNEFAKTMRQEVADAMQDDSPQMRATLLIGMAQLFRLQKAHEGLTTSHTALQKQLDEANAVITRLKGASTSRLKDTGGLPSGQPPKPKESNIFTETADAALDRIRAERAAHASS